MKMCRIVLPFCQKQNLKCCLGLPSKHTTKSLS